VCTVTVGGTVSDNKGLSLPGMDISVPALSAKDVADLEFALGLGVDLVALSFVRSPTDIDLVHAVMDRVGHRVPVIAKLEKPEAVDDIEAVVDAFDGLMVARGDLGVEMPLERVPLVQKRAIQRCREKAKPVIVATQMLDSMIVNPRPTRAEASEVANAVLDGADAVMLSGETSVGAYPVETVETMARIIEEAESDRSGLVPALCPRPLGEADHTQPGLLAQAALAIGDGLDATALVTFTLSGNTVRRLARLHPRQPLVALTPVREVRDQLALSWGTRAVLVSDVASAEDMVRVVDEAVLAMDGFARGDVVVIVAGAPPHTVGVTDLLRVRRLGDDLV
jgi:pyruvate kinase